MKLDEVTTIRVACPAEGCVEAFHLPVTQTMHADRDTDGTTAFIRARIDHTEIDRHISSVHGVALA